MKNALPTYFRLRLQNRKKFTIKINSDPNSLQPTHSIAQKAYADGLEAKTAAMNRKFRLDLAKLRAQ